MTFVKDGKSYFVEFPDSYSELVGYEFDFPARPKNTKYDDIKIPRQVIEALQTGEIPKKFGLVTYNHGTAISCLLDLRVCVAEIIEEVYGISKFDTMTTQIAKIIKENQHYARNWGWYAGEKFPFIEMNDQIIEFGIEYPEYLVCFVSCPDLLIQTVQKIAEKENSGNGKLSPELVRTCLEQIETNPDTVTAFIKGVLLLNDAESFQVFLNPEKNYVNAQNIDDFIELAVDKKIFEIQVLLTNYKYEHIGFSDPTERLKL